MARVPRNGGVKSAMLRTCCQEFIIMVSSPAPFTYCPACGQWNEWDEIDGKPVVMRTLPRPRFRGSLGEEVELPDGTAKTLERFEQGLRLAGFIGAREGLRQSVKAFNRFRVEPLKPSEPSVSVQHPKSPYEHEPTPADAPHGMVSIGDIIRSVDSLRDYTPPFRNVAELVIQLDDTKAVSPGLEDGSPEP